MDISAVVPWISFGVNISASILNVSVIMLVVV